MNRRVPAIIAMKEAPVVLSHHETIQEAAAKMYHMKDYAAPILNTDRRVIGSLSGDSLMTAMIQSAIGF